MTDSKPLHTPKSDRDYLYFQAEEDNAKLSFRSPSSFNVELQYSFDGTNWNTWQSEQKGMYDSFSPLLLDNRGDYVFIRALSTNAWQASDVWFAYFTLKNKKIRCGGNIMSLFSNNLSANTILPSYAFYKMFSNCTYLTAAPELPATTLASRCYQYMFYDCTSLTTAPALPATTLAYGCYASMFENCISLTTAPSLPATALADSCYTYMFYRCTSLTTAPSLPATALADSCYQSMFSDCSRLNSVEVHATNWQTQSASNWLSSVSQTGVFTKPADTSIPTGADGIPSGWTVVNTAS